MSAFHLRFCRQDKTKGSSGFVFPAPEAAKPKALGPFPSEGVQLFERHQLTISESLLSTTKATDKVPAKAAYGIQPFHVKPCVADQNRTAMARYESDEIRQELVLRFWATSA